ncbi:hypothetical protein CDD83_6644 [Cordyceps sp. RAO-2017]|nr:hypothetical protein CDD83_6644 [Cordyceps sp. RAO-2017]
MPAPAPRDDERLWLVGRDKYERQHRRWMLAGMRARAAPTTKKRREGGETVGAAWKPGRESMAERSARTGTTSSAIRHEMRADRLSTPAVP